MKTETTEKPSGSDTMNSLVGLEWMPINTAEKVNGNKILCYGDGYVFEAECEVDDGHHWWCNLGGTEATHWMPLPNPPNTQVEGRVPTEKKL